MNFALFIVNFLSLPSLLFGHWKVTSLLLVVTFVNCSAYACTFFIENMFTGYWTVLSILNYNECFLWQCYAWFNSWYCMSLHLAFSFYFQLCSLTRLVHCDDRWNFWYLKGLYFWHSLLGALVIMLEPGLNVPPPLNCWCYGNAIKQWIYAFTSACKGYSTDFKPFLSSKILNLCINN